MLQITYIRCCHNFHILGKHECQDFCSYASELALCKCASSDLALLIRTLAYWCKAQNNISQVTPYVIFHLIWTVLIEYRGSHTE